MSVRRQVSVSNDRPTCFSLADLGMDEVPATAAFDALTRLALRLFDVPVALISVVSEEDDRQYFASLQGLPEPWATRRETPLSHSFCQMVKRSGEAVIVPDARQDPLFRDNLAIRDLGVVAYLGVPILAPDGSALGAICVISDEPRDWLGREVDLLTELSCCVNEEILLRAALVTNRAETDRITNTHERCKRYNALRETVAWTCMMPDLSVQDRITALLRSACESLGFDSARIVEVKGDQGETRFSSAAKASEGPHCLRDLDGSLAGLVLQSARVFQHSDVPSPQERSHFDNTGTVPDRYVGVPLTVGERIFGVLELSATGARDCILSHEELSIVSIIAMTAATHLGVLEHMQSLDRTGVEVPSSPLPAVRVVA